MAKMTHKEKDLLLEQLNAELKQLRDENEFLVTRLERVRSEYRKLYNQNMALRESRARATIEKRAAQKGGRPTQDDLAAYNSCAGLIHGKRRSKWVTDEERAARRAKMAADKAAAMGGAK